MGGYASRAGSSDGVLDDLFCRVVVIRQGRSVLALVAFDLLYVPTQLVDTVAADIAAALSINTQHVLVSATHTHCGPAIAGPGSTALHQELAAAAQRCALAAERVAVPARLFHTGFSAAELVRHRREPAGTVDGTGSVLLAVSDTADEVIASIVTMACHPTVLDGDTVAYSRDYPGVVCDTVEEICGGQAVFFQGFAGDANPIFHDHSPGDMRLFGRQVGTRAADAILTAQRAARDNWTMNLSRGMKVAAPMPSVARAVDGARLRGQVRHVQVETKEPLTADTVRAELADADHAIASARTSAEHTTAIARRARWWIEDLMGENPPYLGVDLPSGATSTLPVQVLTIGENLRLVALPGEPLHGAAARLRNALGDGVLLVGYAHRAESYLPCLSDFDHLGYEVGSTRYQPGTVERLVEAAIDMVRDTAGGSP